MAISQRVDFIQDTQTPTKKTGASKGFDYDGIVGNRSGCEHYLDLFRRETIITNRYGRHHLRRTESTQALI